MPRGDVKKTRSNYRGGSWGGGSDYHYDDEGRGKSRDIWEWFEENFTHSGYSREWLVSLDDHKYYWLLKHSVERYRLMDIAYHRTPGWFEWGDTRAHRLVVKKLDEDAWLDFHKCLVRGYEAYKEKVRKEMHERAEQQRGEYAAYQAQREAEQAKIEREDWEQLSETINITAGMLSSELNHAFIYQDKVGSNGDWIEEVTDTYIDGSGFGYEDEKAVGIKLQVTVSLDLSNSMYYNGIHTPAAAAYRDLCLALKELKEEYPNDMYTAFFTFSDDTGWENGYGKLATRLTVARSEPKSEHDFMELDMLRPSRIANWYGEGIFTGEDTWLYPLFEEIESWEKDFSDPGALKLDLIVTDAVQEHPTDIRKCDAIQERRDGVLQSVFLNFLPEEEWLGSTLPKRCFHMAVDRDNIAGILRNILSEFVAVHI